MPEQEQSLGRKLMSFFIEEETPKTNPSGGQVPENQQAMAQANAPANQMSVPANTDTGSIDKKFREHFVELIEKSNLKGPDYFEYMQSLKNLQGLGLSEDKLYQAAWASFKAMGGISELSVLTTTANQYIGLLDADREAFLKDVEKAINQRVGGLKNDLQKAQDDNKAFAQQIIDLQNKINENNQNITNITSDIAEQSNKITSNRNAYESTYQSFVTQIKGDLSKIGQYLK